MAEPSDLDLFLGRARLATYLAAAGNDRGRAQDLYLWVTELSGGLHAQLSYVEVAVRNAIDAQLVMWNDAHGCGREWTAPGQTAAPLYQLLRRTLDDARNRRCLVSGELDDARAGLDAEALAVLEAHAVSFGGDRSDALALAVAWQLHVAKLDADRALAWEDRSVWNEHDLAAALLLRDAAEAALAALPDSRAAVREAVARRLDDADARFRDMTVDDTGERMARVAGRTGARGWWWFRVPDSGPIVRDLERYP